MCDNIITLNDESGNEVEFEFLDLIEYLSRILFFRSSLLS